jgi:type II secretory ATPase GspE/PulE/Tfp pilus assembly ATPase PilB-like protein
MQIPAAYRRALVSRLKIMANLDIAERRRPQDGKIRYRLSKDREIELRVATLPTAGSDEDVVLRLLTAKEPMVLDSLEFAPGPLQAIKAMAEKPYGMILCVGPTGSGKTTTLHAILKHINSEERKIWTAEDPIEITQDGLRQVQIHPKIGLTFATALRALLRADPDVIMIGEMRDKETADIAIEASLTGHLVLSTLHTNSAVETVVRLLDLGATRSTLPMPCLGFWLSGSANVSVFIARRHIIRRHRNTTSWFKDMEFQSGTDLVRPTRSTSPSTKKKAARCAMGQGSKGVCPCMSSCKPQKT